MSTIRINKTSNYTVMSNNHFKEKQMSLKAKGLLSLMLSLPEDWDYSIAGLATLSSDGESSIRSGLKELEQFGYLIRRRIYEDGKIVDWEYDIYEISQKNLDVENQQVGNQVVGIQDNKIYNKSNKKEIKEKSDIITVEFLGSANKKTKATLYSKALALIDNFTDNTEIRKSLRRFLDLQLEIYRESKKTFYINIWKSRLNKLKAEFSKDEWLDIINYAISKGWQNFYPIPDKKSVAYDVRKGKAWEENVMSVSITDEEREAEEREADRLEALGIKARF